jgi:hypothetical protein
MMKVNTTGITRNVRQGLITSLPFTSSPRVLD